jgi:Fe-S-cluster containining protein
MIRPEPAMPEFLRGERRLAGNETFPFTCHPGVPCFDMCCGDVNIVLTPLDVLQLSRRLGIGTREFLEEWTLNPITKDLHLPVVMLKMKDGEGRRCPLLGDKGCSVYEHRPWACRMYPLGMALPPARAGEEPEPIFFVFEEDFCQGRHQESCAEWTAETWRCDQGVTERDELEVGFRELVGHPWFIGGRRLDPRRMQMFYMACYDLDSFRSFVFDTSFRERFELEPDLVHKLGTDDEALLRFSFRWLRFALFAEPTMRPRHTEEAQRGKS